MHLHVHRVIRCLLLLLCCVVAVAAHADPGGTHLFFPNPTQGGQTGNFQNLHVGPGSISITGSPNGTNQISGVSVNGVLNAGGFPGADIGAQINNAVAALPQFTEPSTQITAGSIAGNTLTVTSIYGGGGGLGPGLLLTGTGIVSGTRITAYGTATGGTGTYVLNNSMTVASEVINTIATYPMGTVFVPRNSTSTPQIFTTPIGGQNPPWTFVKLTCDQGAKLEYTGPGAYWIDMLDPYAVNGGAVGGVYDCTFIAPATVVPNQAIIHFGNQHGFHVIGNEFENFVGTGDACVLAENTVYFTESWWIDGNEGNTISNLVTFNERCSPGAPACGPSFLHGMLRSYCGQGYDGSIHACLWAKSTGGTYGASIQYETLDLQFNLNGSNSDVSVVKVDGAPDSKFYQNVGTLIGEDDTAFAPNGHGLMFSATGGTYYELNNLHAACQGCGGVNAPAGIWNQTYFQWAGRDQMWSSGAETWGALPGNVYVSEISPVTQVFAMLSFTCRNLTGGGCVTAPSFHIWNGSTDYMAVTCPTTLGSTVSTTVNATAYPDSPLFMTLNAAGSGCTAPWFNVYLHYRTD